MAQHLGDEDEKEGFNDRGLDLLWRKHRTLEICAISKDFNFEDARFKTGGDGGRKCSKSMRPFTCETCLKIDPLTAFVRRARVFSILRFGSY